ncbi:MAG: hypothetical protein NZM12_04480, partial [Steroidobacteraceae bacterium]|nr:hypothetical protein [Steroidobacteraceae bacterium]
EWRMCDAWEKFAAASVLLAGSGTTKERLLAAYRCELAQLDLDSLPTDLRDEYDALHAALHRERPLKGEDPVRATLRKISGAEADQIAQRLVRLSIHLARASARANSDRPAAAVAEAPFDSSARVVPLFPA